MRTMCAIIQPHKLVCVLMLVDMLKQSIRHRVVQVRHQNSQWLRRSRVPSPPPTVKKGVPDDVPGLRTVADRKCNFLATRESFVAIFRVLKTSEASPCDCSKIRYQMRFFIFLVNTKKEKKEKTFFSPPAEMPVIPH